MAMRKTGSGRPKAKVHGKRPAPKQKAGSKQRSPTAAPARATATRAAARGATKSARSVAPRATASRVRPQPLLAVRDVQASAGWYARLLDAVRSSVMFESDHAHLYDRIMVDDALVLQLHAWDEEEHPNLMNASAARPGHGVLVWFEVDDFDATVRRARALKAKVVRKPHVNPAPAHREMWIEDLDGYVVVVASPDGEAEGR